MNHGPEWNVEFSIPIQTSSRHFSNFWVLKMSDFTKRNFSHVDLPLTDIDQHASIKYWSHAFHPSTTKALFI